MGSASFVLGFWQQEHEQRGIHGIHVCADITREEFDSYLDAISIYRAVTERGTYELLRRNWHQITSMRDMYANLERIGGNFRAIDRRSVAVGFMGAVMNWLASTHLYIETERTSITRDFGESSDEIQRYETIRRNIFGWNTGCRFLYNLRDYAQHCGPPLGGLTVAARDDGARSLELYLSRSDLLLARFDWNRRVKRLLESWPEQIFLLPLIEEAMSGYRRIETEVLALLMARCGAAIPRMREGIARAGATTGLPAVFRLPQNEDEADRLTYQDFPESSMLDVVERALGEPDPVAAVRGDPAPEATSLSTPEVLHCEAQAAAVVGAWLEYGPGVELNETINHVLREDRGIDPLVSGLVNLCAYLLAMLAQSLGTSPQGLLGTFVSDISR